jgi:site-specific recombinase XerD
MNYPDYMNEYIEYLMLSGSSVKNPKTALKKLTAYCKDIATNYLYFRPVDAQKFQEYLLDRGELASSSVAVLVGAVTSFYDYLFARELILSNPFAGIYRLKQGKSLPRNILVAKDLVSLLGFFRTFNRGKHVTERRRLYKAHLIAELFYATGIRRKELSTITLSDVDLLRGMITITDSKSKRRRSVYMGEYCRQILSVYITKTRPFILTDRQDGALLFGSSASLSVWFNSLLKTACKSLDVKAVTAHSFRHSFGVHLLSKGCDIRYIQEMLGHKALSSTQVYTRVDKADLLAVVDKCHPRSLKVAS